MRPKKRHSNAALSGAQGRHLGNLHATNRLKNNLVGSVLRSRNSSWDAAGLSEPSQTDSLARIIIDYNKLCDDIYITDWI